jgi:hypothetical protein
VFRAQVAKAASAVTAQFQAETCLRKGFCYRTETFVDWVENHSFGDEYPQHRLPVKACMMRPGNPKQAAVRAQLCSACKRVTRVRIKRGSCVPHNAPLVSPVVQPGSLRARCDFMADVIANDAQRLLTELSDSVCSCLGCCGDGHCYFPNVEQLWMDSLVETATSKFATLLESDASLASFLQEKK